MDKIFLCESLDNIVLVFGSHDPVFCKEDILKGGFEEVPSEMLAPRP